MQMDIAYLGENSIRIKGKNATLIVDPSPVIGKTEADAILLTDKILKPNISKIAGYRIVIKGQGEYEVGGVKVSTSNVDDKLLSRLDVDGVKVLLAPGFSLEKVHEKLEEADIVLVNAENEFNYSVLPSLEPKVLLVYGSKREEVSKSLGKEASKASKYSTTADKLPGEMEFLVLE
jgi:hypothetical protein